MSTFFREKSIWIVSAFLLLVTVIIFIATPSGVKPKVENVTKIYFADNISIAHKELIKRFNEEYAGKIEVVPVNLPFTKFSTNERKELLARTLRSKSNRIDVFSVDVIWVPRFAKWCESMEAHFPESYRRQLLQPVLTSCFYNDSLYAIPLYYDMGIMYYRSDLIQSLPEAADIEKKIKESISWKDFIQLSRYFKNKNRPYYYFAGDSFEGLMCSFIELLASLDQPLISNGKVHLLNEKALLATKLLVDLVNRYRMTPPEVTGYDEFKCYQEMISKGGVFLRGWPGFLRHYRFVIPDTTKFKFLKKAPLPHFENGKRAFVFGGWNLMVSKFSEKKEEAIEFIKFALREENQKMLFKMGGYLPVNKKVYQDSAYLASEPDLKFYQSILPFGVHRPYLENYTKISDIITYFLNQAIRKNLSPKQALEQATQLINENYVMIK